MQYWPYNYPVYIGPIKFIVLMSGLWRELVINKNNLEGANVLQEFASFVLPEHALITRELYSRPTRPVDPRRETVALQDLARRMLDQPDTFLPHLVSQAMQVSEAHSAGLSIYEPDAPEGDIFRWYHLTGLCAHLSGRTVPRHPSPCGLCLDARESVLITHPEICYPHLAEPGVSVHEALLTPIFLGGAQPLGVLWVLSHDPARNFDASDARALTELASFAGIAIKMISDAQALKRSLELQEIMTREMAHRINNLLTVTGGLISAGARTAKTPMELANNVRSRLQALGRAHSLAANMHHRDSDGLTGELSRLIAVIAAPYSDQAKPRILIGKECGGSSSSEEVLLGKSALTGLGLALHELATNAVKYGALSAPGGRVLVDWQRNSEALTIVWEEQGGPEPSEVTDTPGFGSTLLHRTITGQFGGELRRAWLKQGLRAELSIPLERLRL